MALATMNKLTIVGLQQDKDTLYDVLIASRSVQLCSPENIELCATVADNSRVESLLVDSSDITTAIDTITNVVAHYNDAHGKQRGFTKFVVPQPTMARPLVEMHYSQLSSMSDNMAEVNNKVNDIARLNAEINSWHSRINQIDVELDKLQLYSNLPHAIDSYVDTDSTTVVLGSIVSTNLPQLQQLITEDMLAELTIVGANSSDTAVLLVVHKSCAQLVNDALSVGLNRCNVTSSVVTSKAIVHLQTQRTALNKDISHNNKQICQYCSYVPTLRTAYDYIAVQLAKVEADNGAPKTGSTMVLEAYAPADKVEGLRLSLDSMGLDVAVYAEDIAIDEEAPILYRNNAVVRQFEGVTNMYTPPSYHELDPNPIMSIFYFIIFGLMVADMGYGLVLILAGILANILIKQNSGTKSLLTLFGMCGVSAVAVGALYGTCFGYLVFDGVLPDPSMQPMVTMVLALLFGLIHIMVGFVLKMVKQVGDKQYVLAFGVSLMWALFFAFAFMAVLELALHYTGYAPFVAVDVPDIVANIGLYGLIASLVVSLLCAGGGGKVGIGKRLTSGFGGIYGLIGLFSDVVSYIRIFGLMLSSAMMAAVINDLSISMSANGILGMVACGVLLLIGHLFNLAVGMLSVYIHCGRLQYVEFFSKFYQGDGQLFQPFGSNIKYTLLK